MVNALSELFSFIHNIIIGLLSEVSGNHSEIALSDIVISPGIGQVTWFTVRLEDLISIILYVVIVVALIRYTVKFVKWIWSFASRLFGGK